MLGDELGGLIGQLPRGLIVITCGAGLLWLGLMVYFAVIRPSRIRARSLTMSATPTPAYVGAPVGPQVTPAPAPAVHEPMELPDLDLLTTGHEPEVPPAAVPATITSTIRAAASAARRLGSADIKLSDGSIIHAPEMLVILRDPRDQRPIVQVGDTGYKSLDESPAVRATLEKLLAELNQPMPQAPPRLPTSEIPRPAPPVFTPPPPTGGAMPGDLPKYSELKDELKSRGAFRQHKTEMPNIPELNIPAAIEAYLQYKKSFDPEYSKRNIHVHPAPGGGVRIEVDGMFYDSVGDVADPDVRAFLQSTIQEWQSRQ